MKRARPRRPLSAVQSPRPDAFPKTGADVQVRRSLGGGGGVACRSPTYGHERRGNPRTTDTVPLRVLALLLLLLPMQGASDAVTRVGPAAVHVVKVTAAAATTAIDAVPPRETQQRGAGFVHVVAADITQTQNQSFRARVAPDVWVESVCNGDGVDGVGKPGRLLLLLVLLLFEPAAERGKARGIMDIDGTAAATPAAAAIGSPVWGCGRQVLFHWFQPARKRE